MGLACLAEALVELSRGGESADRSLRRLQALRGDVGALAGPVLRPFALAVEARLLHCGEQPQEAFTTLRRGLETFPGSPVLLVARGRLELSGGEPELASATLDAALAEPASRTLRVEGLVLAAVACRARREQVSALAALEQALALAESERVRQPFLDCGRAVGDLLADLLHAGTSHRWLVGELLPLSRAAPPDRRSAELLDPLSEREQEVLRYLPTMMSNADIAAELFISVNTVKTHVKSIYRKLGTSRRRDAVHRARQLRLL